MLNPGYLTADKQAFKCSSTKSRERVGVKKERKKNNQEHKSSDFGSKTLGILRLYQI